MKCCWLGPGGSQKFGESLERMSIEGKFQRVKTESECLKRTLNMGKKDNAVASPTIFGGI